jgi:hypothetical protein
VTAVDAVVVEVPGGMTAGAAQAAESSAVAWGAVIGGAFVIAAVGLILLALGAGFGLSSVSPWPSAGVSLTTFGVMTAIWLVVVQWVSSGVGGYVAGRLRTKWTGIHSDEVYFRDTAHGVLAWAVAAVLSVAVLASAAAILTGGAALGTTTVASTAPGTAQNGAARGSNPYIVDTLFRSDRPDSGAGGADVRGEAARILALSVAPGGVPDADKPYLAQLVSARTGVSQDEAKRRVDDAMTKTRQAADAARKAAMRFSLFTAFSMLIGAFIAGVAAKIGGHHRDDLATL